MILEKNIQKAVMAELSKYGLVFRTNAGKAKSLVGNRIIQLLPDGFSDLLFLGENGRCVFIEMKQANGEQRQSQKDFQCAVERLGFEYYIIRSVDEVRGIFQCFPTL